MSYIVFFLNFSQKLDVRSSNKYVTFQKLPFYYIRKSVRKQYENNKLKLIAPTWNDEFQLPDSSYSVSDIQDYVEYIKKT